MTTKDLQQAWQDAERKAQKLMADKDEALGRVRERFTEKLQAANEAAATAQKTYLDAAATDELRARADQVDAALQAEKLGLEL